MDFSTLKARVDALSAPFRPNSLEEVNRVMQGTLTVMSAVYGDESNQVKTLLKSAEEIRKKQLITPLVAQELSQLVRGTISNLKEEIEAGILGSLQKRIAGDILTDFTQLAKTVLENKGDDAKNVAAVLVAAAFEDTIRRMGSSFAGVMGRDKLDEVINALKNAGILQAPQLGIAISYLSFRNHALHADWQQIDRASVHSALGFVEQLLLKYFQ
jgi:hypothetical protein